MSSSNRNGTIMESNQNSSSPIIDNTTNSSRILVQELLWTEAKYQVLENQHPPSTNTQPVHRTDSLSWEDYFMAIALLSSQRSKDPHLHSGMTNAIITSDHHHGHNNSDSSSNPNTIKNEKDPIILGQGACIVDAQKRIVGIGYDGFPRNCPDDCLPWATSYDFDSSLLSHHESFLHTRDPYLVHAEVNAILNKCTDSVQGCTMYVPYFPCNECAKILIQAGIAQIVYMYEHKKPVFPTTEKEGNSSHLRLSQKDQMAASRILFTMAGVKMRRFLPRHGKITLDLTNPMHQNVPSGTRRTNHHVETKAEGEEEEEMFKSPVESTSNASENPIWKYRTLLLKEARGYDPTKPILTKRKGYLSWDDYFIAIAFLSAKRSKDPNTQVGACIVDSKNRCIIGIGYNGFPRGCSDEHLPWARHASCQLHTKYPYVVHAEVNAIMNKCSKDVRGATLYVALFPCNECAKVIIQAGISEVVYLRDVYHDSDACRASRIMFEMAGVKIRQYHPSIEHLDIHYQCRDTDE